MFPHWCPDETAAALTLLDSIPMLWVWLKTKWGTLVLRRKTV